LKKPHSDDMELPEID